MAINLSDNIKVSAPKPVDSRYLNVTGGTYLNLPAVCASIPIGERYLGLTVLVKSGASNVEYWFKDNVNTLIEKKYDTVVPFSDYLTGASSMGDYVQCSSVQRLVLVGFGGSGGVDDCFYSQNNNYFVDCSGYVRIGEYPHRGPVRRAYVNSARTWSWIFNAGTGSWIETNYDITTRVSCTISCDYVSLYNNVLWTGYTTTGGTSVTPSGTLSSGCTVIYGAPVYSCLEKQDAHFRSIVSDTPNLLGVSYDEYYVRLSGTTAVLRGENIGTGEDVFAESISSGTTLYFKRLRGSGNTQVTTVGDSVVIFTSLSGGTTYITGATNIGSSGGTGVFDSRDNVTLQFRNLVGSGDTSVSLSGDSIVIYTDAGEDTYNLSSPAAICVGGICVGTVLTGKTAFELFEELLVPELCGSITAPSLSIGLTCTGCKEIGTVISQTVTGTFSRGAINPQYCSVSPFRSGCVNAYCFAGCGMPSGWQSCVLSPGSATNASYIVSAGTQTWSVQAQYDAGFPALGSKGTEYCAALPSGTTSVASGSVCGILPWYWGVSSSGTINGTCVANGNKTLATVGASTPITFNATAQYLWFAAPAGTYTTKTKWWVCAANAGNIGGTGNLWAAACNVSVSSLEGCWSGCSYDVYVTCGITTTATGIPMCLYY